MRWRLSILAAISSALVATVAHAQGDTTYGRLDGDVGFVVGAGITVAPRAPRASFDLRLRYLDSVGVFATYEDAPLIAQSSDPQRVIAVGAELRPLFLARWATGTEVHRDRLDLLIDSLGLELGVFFAQPAGGSFASRAGVQFGLGVELPILAQPSGPWIGVHGGVRWSEAAISGDSVTSPTDSGVFLSVTLAWHQLFLAHVVDVDDRAPR